MSARRLLVASIGSHGDVHPFLGVAAELLRRGHDVTALVNAHYRPLAERLGLRYAELGTEEDYLAVLRNRDMWRPSRTWRLRARFLPIPMEFTFEAVARGGFDLVVAHPFLLGARVAEEKLGTPLVTLLPQPSALRSVHEPPREAGDAWLRLLPRALRTPLLALRERRTMDRPLAPAVNRFRGRLGLPPVRGGFREWRLSRRRVVGLWPEWFAAPQPDWPPQVRLAGFPLWDGAGVTAVPPEVEAFLASGPPPVLFVPGTAMLQSRAFFDSSLEACRRLSLRALLLGGDPGSAAEALPPFARHAPYAPLSLLLPRAAAIVHHAGIGTSAQALRAGTPQLLKPIAYDQFDNAERVSRLGCGVVLPDRRYDARRAEAALRGLLQRPHRCAEAAARLRTGEGLSAACDLAIDALRVSSAEGV